MWTVKKTRHWQSMILQLLKTGVVVSITADMTVVFTGRFKEIT